MFWLKVILVLGVFLLSHLGAGTHIGVLHEMIWKVMEAKSNVGAIFLESAAPKLLLEQKTQICVLETP